MKRFLLPFLSQKRIAGGALVLAVTQFAASICGFLRDRAFSVMFPIQNDPIGVASVYIAAFRPSDLLFQLFVMSSLSVILVPFLASHLAHDRRDEMNRVTCSILVIFGSVFGVIILLTGLFFPMLAPYLVKFTGPSLALYIQFGRFALITNALFVLGNTLGQYLIAVQKYWIYGITPIIWAFGTIGGIYFLTPHFGPIGVMYGTVIGTAAYIMGRLYGAYKSGFRFMLPTTGFLHADVAEMGWLIIPRMMALGALQLQLLLIDRLGSGLGNGIVAINQFASNFESVIPGIAGIAIAQSIFSLLGQAHAKGETQQFWSYIKKGIGLNLALTIPGAIAMALLTSVAAWLLHLQPAVSSVFQTSLLIYAIAVPFEGVNHILLRAFYSMKNTLTPAITTALSAACGISAGYLLVSTYGIYALAIAYIVTQSMQTLFLSVGLVMDSRAQKRITNYEVRSTNLS
ncbi:MAG: hypothetical protein KBD00_02945 [Candidatus Peribacteraceae bacterium]|nr:hypothetical protein [Candidatus Peribacteraceae bacterium]